MSTTTDAIVDAFQRVQQIVQRTAEGLDEAQLTFRIDAEANTVAWLVWHLTRVQDAHLAELTGGEQVYTADVWHDRFGLPFDPEETGYGQSPDEVAEVRGVAADDLLGYHDAVVAKTIAYVRGLTDDDFARVVDTSWNPPVTLSSRLVSVISDDLQHAGQASYVRGIAQRQRG